MLAPLYTALRVIELGAAEEKPPTRCPGWQHILQLCGFALPPSYRHHPVMVNRCIGRRLSGKSWHGHFGNLLSISGSPIVIPYYFSDQERELSSHVSPHTLLLGDIGLAVGLSEDQAN